MQKPVSVIGAGLAGCEAAWQLAKRGVPVRLFEMKPVKHSPAHKADGFCELVCSNSLRAAALTNAVGLLKEEMRRLSSIVIEAADNTSVPAGGALSVDRDKFSQYVTDKLTRHPLVTVCHEEVSSVKQEGITIVASGPLTEGALYESIGELVGERLCFFDAAAPIVTDISIDKDKAFFGSRYEKGGDDYLNCPMTREEYYLFYNELISAECAELHEFEGQVFEGCMPVEVMAKRGDKTLLFGPLKPVGLIDPKTGREPFSCVQLRRENRQGTLYNLVGFQTHLKFPEQRRVFSMIPALRNAEFQRYGVMHKNTFLRSPGLLDGNYRLLRDTDIYFAGQMTGVEGYVESAASGLFAGISAAMQYADAPLPVLSAKTAIGALAEYVSKSASFDFQPMNICFGIIDQPVGRFRKKAEKRAAQVERALMEIDEFVKGEKGV